MSFSSQLINRWSSFVLVADFVLELAVESNNIWSVQMLFSMQKFRWVWSWGKEKKKKTQGKTASKASYFKWYFKFLTVEVLSWLSQLKWVSTYVDSISENFLASVTEIQFFLMHLSCASGLCKDWKATASKGLFAASPGMRYRNLMGSRGIRNVRPE